MSASDFDRLVGLYLDGEASRSQVLALRKALRERPELKQRLAALVRLHRAQSAALRGPVVPSLGSILSQLRALADRAGRSLVHACILVLVCVELDVAIPRVDSQAWVNGGRPTPVMVPLSEVIGGDKSPLSMPAELSSVDRMPVEGDMSDPMGMEGGSLMPMPAAMPSSAGAIPPAPDYPALGEG
jgi:hypothetical protein